LPKAHLHLHLSGALRPTLLRELLDRDGLPDPEPADGTFETFLRSMAVAAQALRTPDDYARLLHELAEDAAAEGVVWLEPATSLRPALAQQLALPDQEAVLKLLIAMASDAERDTGVGIGFMVAANRTRSPSEAEHLAALASRYAGRGVVSFGLADDERRGPAEQFGQAFAIARSAGLISAPHAGEHGGPESVRAALDVLGAGRVQHGVRAIEDTDLVHRLVDEQICLDVCPTSNAHLKVVPELESHQLPALVEAGVRVSLNADCPTVFGCGLLGEYELSRRVFGFDDRTLATIAETSIRASGAPEALRSAAVANIARWTAGAQ
jgi:adenosine deaminase